MGSEGEPKKVLADELESLRHQIAHLRSLILQNPALDNGTGGGDQDSQDKEKYLPRIFFDNSPFGMALIDARFRVVMANKALCNMLDSTEEQICSVFVHELVREPDIGKQLIACALDGQSPCSRAEAQIMTRRGQSIWVQLNAMPFPGEYPGGHLCLLTLEDISPRKTAEAALQSEKQLLERLVNSSLDGIFAFDRNLILTVWNPAMERIFGLGAHDTLGKSIHTACPFLIELGEEANFAAALRGEKVISRDKAYLVPGTGRRGCFEAYYGPMYDTPAGQIIGGLAVIREVTERKSASESKRLSEERYRELFENAYDLMYTQDLSGTITAVNKAAERITGFTRAEILQMRFSQLVAPEFQETVRMMMNRQLVEQVPITQELDIIRKDGSRATLEVSHRLIFQEGKPIGLQGVARDVTERKKTEEALQQANRKLEAWVRELEQRTREMTLLSEMGDILRACLTKEEIYAVIERTAQEIFPLQAGALFVLGPLRNIVEAVAEWGDTSGLQATFAPEECWALRRGRAHWVEDKRVGLLCKHLGEPLPAGYICVPMMAQSEAVGILHIVQSQGAPMVEAKLRLAMAMAEHVAMALSNLKLHETLRTQSIRDQLTGLFNRNFMEESLELELRRASRAQHQFSVIMLALDNFQLLNDSFGLDVGDSVLRKAGMLIQNSVRKGDIACRYSGHTYVVILPQSSGAVGLKRADNLRNLVRTLEVKYRGEQVGQITVSVGLAVYPDHGQTVETLLRSAEAALNRAKNSGGDCVVIAA